MRAAKKDMEDGLSLDQMMAKYPKAKVTREVLIVRSAYTNYRNEDVVKFREVDPVTDSEQTLTFTKKLSHYKGKLAGQWLYEYEGKGLYSEETLRAFYIPTEFTSAPLPDKYNRMIGYATCLIDTSTTKFKHDASYGWFNFPMSWDKLSHDEKVDLLDSLRSTRVMGSCSMDDSPRRHAVNIAMLAAETYQWQVFLKAHLDVMNDYFERMSDGSYAQAGRKTYIKELEELNINVPDLILGICLRIENPPTNHYYGGTIRVGRALTETKNPELIELMLLGIIGDNRLDDYNRAIAYFLYHNYMHYLGDSISDAERNSNLKEAQKRLPEYMANR
jgi:hypothetical protein